MRFEYWQIDENTWTWQLVSSLGDTLAHGTSYPSRDLCLMAIKLVKLAAGATSIELYAAPAASRAPFSVGERAAQLA